MAESGPRGGDELNVLQRGRNYGWPVVSWGKYYDGTKIPSPPTRPEFARSIHHWDPVITPSGMTFYTGERFPEWQGNLLVGALTSREIVRLTLQGQSVTSEERIPLGHRIRDVEQGKHGSVYVLTDGKGGDLIRLRPKG